MCVFGANRQKQNDYYCKWNWRAFIDNGLILKTIFVKVIDTTKKFTIIKTAKNQSKKEERKSAKRIEKKRRTFFGVCEYDNVRWNDVVAVFSGAGGDMTFDLISRWYYRVR